MLNLKQLISLTAVFLLLCLVSIFFVDQPLIFFIDQHAGALQPVFKEMTSYTDLITGYTYSKYLFGIIVLVGGVVMVVIDKNLTRAKYFFFVSVTEFASTSTVGMLKNVFGRERPSSIIGTKQFVQTFWIAGGDSFPSGHVGRYFGIFLHLAVLFPTYRMAWLIVPVYISLGRIILNLHFLSDVLTSLYLVIVVTSLFGYLFKVKPLEERLLQES